MRSGWFTCAWADSEPSSVHSPICWSQLFLCHDYIAHQSPDVVMAQVLNEVHPPNSYFLSKNRNISLFSCFLAAKINWRLQEWRQPLFFSSSVFKHVKPRILVVRSVPAWWKQRLTNFISYAVFVLFSCEVAGSFSIEQILNRTQFIFWFAEK